MSHFALVKNTLNFVHWHQPTPNCGTLFLFLAVLSFRELFVKNYELSQIGLK